jgi:hypothetical protein
VDFDGDGDLDLSLTGAGADGMHHLLRNNLSPEARARSLQVMVLDEFGHATRAGTEVRLYVAGTDTLLGTGILDTGSGYNSQNVVPVHFGLASEGPVDIAITSMTTAGRVTALVRNVDPLAQRGSVFFVKVNSRGTVVP